MDKRNQYVIGVIVLLVLLGLAIFFFFMRAPEKSPLVPALTMRVQKAEEALNQFEEETLSQKALLHSKGTAVAQASDARQLKMSERKISGGNQGYIVRDGTYVYFGINTIIREEVAE